MAKRCSFQLWAKQELNIECHRACLKTFEHRPTRLRVTRKKSTFSADFNSAEASFNIASADFNNAEASFNSAEANFNIASADFNNAEADFNNAEANFNIASADFNNAEASFNNAEASFNNAEASFNNAEASFNSGAASFNSCPAFAVFTWTHRVTPPTAADELETAHGDVQTAVTMTSIMHEKEAALEILLRQLAGYIESVADDDESKILGAGISIRTTTPTTQTPETPSALSLTEGDHDGEIDLSWDTVKGAKSYVIERSPDPPTATSWAHEAVSSKSSATVSGLVSGTRYWFRVAAVMSSGQSGWSDPATKIAP